MNTMIKNIDVRIYPALVFNDRAVCGEVDLTHVYISNLKNGMRKLGLGLDLLSSHYSPTKSMI